MEKIVNEKLVFNTDEIKEIIKEHLSRKGIDISLNVIDFYGTSLNYVNRDDYMGIPKFNLKNVVCQTIYKNSQNG